MNPILCDLTDESQMKSKVRDILPIHLLVNNAGITFPTPILDTSVTQFDSIFNVNVKVPFLLSQFIAKDLKERKDKGSIVNISSLAGDMANQDRCVYSCSKATLNMLTQSTAFDYGDTVRINAVSPAVVKTDMAATNWSDKDIKKFKMLQERLVFKDPLEPNEIADSVLFLLSNQASKVTGQILHTDGGFL